MKKNCFKSCLSMILALVLVISTFAIVGIAADGGATVVTQPSNRSFYQGIDWTYNQSGKITLIKGDFNIAGTVISYNGANYEYTLGEHWANMKASPASGSWTVGDNQVKIRCDSLPSSVYAVTTLKLVAVKSIAVVTPPYRSSLLLGVDWNEGAIMKDVEFTDYKDLSGLVIKVTYNDSSVKNIAATDNNLIGWSMPQDVDIFYPGKNTVYATFCGKQAAFEVDFIKSLSFQLGDVSTDNKFNSYDALLTLQHATGSAELRGEPYILADVNKDGFINSTDALYILQRVVGIIKNF